MEDDEAELTLNKVEEEMTVSQVLWSFLKLMYNKLYLWGNHVFELQTRAHGWSDYCWVFKSMRATARVDLKEFRMEFLRSALVVA